MQNRIRRGSIQQVDLSCIFSEYLFCENGSVAIARFRIPNGCCSMPVKFLKGVKETGGRFRPPVHFGSSDPDDVRFSAMSGRRPCYAGPPLEKNGRNNNGSLLATRVSSPYCRKLQLQRLPVKLTGVARGDGAAIPKARGPAIVME